jgi:hypothetical protein
VIVVTLGSEQRECPVSVTGDPFRGFFDLAKTGRLTFDKLADEPQRSQGVGRQAVPQAPIERLGLQPPLLDPFATVFGRCDGALPDLRTRLGNSLVEPLGGDRPVDLFEVLGEQREHQSLEYALSRVRVG